jgi:integrase/recombinase XerC
VTVFDPARGYAASVFSSVSDALADFITTRKLEQRSRRTVKNYLLDLQPFVDFMADRPMGDITPSVVKEYLTLSQLKHPTRGTGIWAHRARYNSLRVFLRWSVTEGYLLTNPLTVRPPKMPSRIMPVFTDNELRTMLTITTGRGSNDKRDHAILMTLIDTGIRLNELVNIKAHHIDWDTGTLLIVWPTTKGNKERQVVLSRRTLLSIYTYLKTRRSAADELWLSEERRPLTASGIGQIIKRTTHKALGTPSGPHKFRHTYACSFLANGGSIDNLQYNLGHSSLQMCLHYAEATKKQRALDQSKRFSPVERLHL